jgi:hypothetical protein
MTEKLSINGRDVWVMIEPLTVPQESSQTVSQEGSPSLPLEYFIVSYSMEEPGGNAGEMLRDADNRPKLFESPVAALQYANEKLLEMI